MLSGRLGIGVLRRVLSCLNIKKLPFGSFLFLVFEIIHNHINPFKRQLALSNRSALYNERNLIADRKIIRALIAVGIQHRRTIKGQGIPVKANCFIQIAPHISGECYRGIICRYHGSVQPRTADDQIGYPLFARLSDSKHPADRDCQKQKCCYDFCFHFHSFLSHIIRCVSIHRYPNHGTSR